MKVLAVDTSSDVASVAVLERDRVLSEFTIHHKKTHSQKLLPMISEVLRSLELTPGDIDLFAASSGPGSFTGLRIGVTTVKAMAYAAKKPVVGVPTLDALAYNIPLCDRLVCPLMDARNNQVYTAIYGWDKDIPVNITEYMGIPINELADILKSKNKPVIFLGDAVEIHKAYLKGEFGERCVFAPVGLLLQRAVSVARAAIDRASNGFTENCFEMLPFYLRKSQAERELEKKQLGV